MKNFFFYRKNLHPLLEKSHSDSKTHFFRRGLATQESLVSLFDCQLPLMHGLLQLHCVGLQCEITNEQMTPGFMSIFRIGKERNEALPGTWTARQSWPSSCGSLPGSVPEQSVKCEKMEVRVYGESVRERQRAETKQEEEEEEEEGWGGVGARAKKRDSKGEHMIAGLAWKS